MKNTYRILFSASLALTVTMATGCPGDDGGGDGGAEGTGGTTGTGGDTGTASMTGPGSADGTGTSTTTTATTATTATAGSTGEPMPQPNGAECSDNAECESEMCFLVGVFGGICGECLGDDDCPDGGCSIPNPIAMPPEGATCNMGEQGEGCETDEVCMGDQVCAEILSVPNILTANTCSDCNETADCTDQICNPSYDIAELSGFKTCVDAGTVALGEGCTIGDEGNMACDSGFCGTADVMGLAELGVCSECLVDQDCVDLGLGTTCMAPVVDLATGLVAGTCQ